MKLEISAYRPSGSIRAGALAMDLETGVAVFVNSERHHLTNQRLAEERLTTLLNEAVSPGSWIR